MVIWVTSTFRETELTTSRGALLLFGSTRNEMQKMQWIPWIIHSLTGGKSEFRWRSMVDRLTRIALAQVGVRTTATIDRDRREEGHTPQDAVRSQDPSPRGDVILDQGHLLEKEATAPDPDHHQRDVFQGRVQEVVTEGNLDHQLLKDQISQDLVLVQEKDHVLAQPLRSALPPPRDLDPLADLVLLLPIDHQQEKHPGHPDKMEKTRMMLIIRMTIELVHVFIELTIVM